MNFHLQFPIPSFREKISYSDKMLFIGSCFAESIGERMKQHKFSLNINPHGILYNPASIAMAIRRYVRNGKLNEKELFFANEKWNSWEHHSRFSHPDKNICLENINKYISDAHSQLTAAEWLFITFGSAFVYSLTDGKTIVGNCHKLPQKKFEKQLLEPKMIVDDFKQLFTDLKELNPSLDIVLTVSPVKYIRDGVIENTISKSVLIQAVHELVRTQDNVIYFPAYELVTDDLRDYRFYEADLVHPNEQAISYVFEKFGTTAFDASTLTVFEKIKEIRTAALHKPFNQDSDSNKKFAAVYLKRCTDLLQGYPMIDLEPEIHHFRALSGSI
ncbi:MAG TPA: GSCFA domain-containing protein [Bacteroidia bacterium]|jgi:hypothetical protein